MSGGLMSDTIIEATPLTREEIQTRWTQDLALIFTTLETMSIERDWCGAWNSLVRVANNAITVKLPQREVKYRAAAIVPNDSWCLQDLPHYARMRMDQSRFEEIIDLETKPVFLPESLSNEELLRVWEQDIRTINTILNQGAIDNSKAHDWVECIEEVNPALRFKLVADLEREVNFTITFSYRGTMTVPYDTEVYDYVVENLDIEMHDLDVDDVSWGYA